MILQKQQYVVWRIYTISCCLIRKNYEKKVNAIYGLFI